MDRYVRSSVCCIESFERSEVIYIFNSYICDDDDVHHILLYIIHITSTMVYIYHGSMIL